MGFEMNEMEKEFESEIDLGSSEKCPICGSHDLTNDMVCNNCGAMLGNTDALDIFEGDDDYAEDF